MSLVHHLKFSLSFPSGLSPGDGQSGNLLTVSTDGSGRPVLRGSSLCGALRSAYARSMGESKKDGANVSKWFGLAFSDRKDQSDSRLIVADTLLDVGLAGKAIRTHNAIDRHTGAAIHGGLFSLESFPPGTTGAVLLTLTDVSGGGGEEFLRQISGILESGIQLGGRSARGIGRVVVHSTVHRAYDLSRIEDHAAFLDVCWGKPLVGQPLAGISPQTQLSLTVTFGIPRGQDLCVGDGDGLDHTVEPQAVVDVHGIRLWRIPGSALRGIFRGWIARLAARDRWPVADSVDRELAERAVLGGSPKRSGRDLAWGFIEDEAERRRLQVDPSRITCPVMRLFGSAYSKGRIHFSDSTSKVGDGQSRMHVSIDRFSGGANDGFLFSHEAITGNARFCVQITVDSPTEQEADWLLSSLRALDMGLLRVGSSKSSGRLCIQSPPIASGRHSERFKDVLQPVEVK